MFLQHLWQNTDDENEVLFLFQIDDIENQKTLINKFPSKTLAQTPEVNLPTMPYLTDKKILSTNLKSEI